MGREVRIGIIVLSALLFLTISIGFFNTDSWAGGDAAKGKKVFMANCMVCHGQSGQGDGPAAATMEPKPRNFTSAKDMKEVDDARMKKSIMDGRPGTAMVGFAKTLSAKDIDDVMAFLNSLLK